MQEGHIVAIYISPIAGENMEYVEKVLALARAGLKGDRYCTGEGSFNKKTGVGNRQVTLINALFFRDSGFTYAESRRNIIASGIELMDLIGKKFQVCRAVFKGVKYCSPCERPNSLIGKSRSFRESFSDRGGIIAEIIEGGEIWRDGPIIPPPKGY